jgi:Flp pilus assembly protein TadB
VRLPRDISAAAERRRSLLFDAIGAIVIAIFVIIVSAGLGIVALVALITLAILVVWIGVEALLRRLRRRRPSAARRRPASAAASDRTR